MGGCVVQAGHGAHVGDGVLWWWRVGCGCEQVVVVVVLRAVRSRW